VCTLPSFILTFVILWAMPTPESSHSVDPAQIPEPWEATTPETQRLKTLNLAAFDPMRPNSETRMLLGDEGTSVKLTFRKDNQLSNFQEQEASGGNVMSLCTASGLLQGDFQDYDVEIKRMTASNNDQMGLNVSSPDGRAGQL